MLFDEGGAAVLADFGIAELAVDLHGQRLREAPSGGFHKDRIVGTLQYLGPEVLRNNYHTQVRGVKGSGRRSDHLRQPTLLTQPLSPKA